MPDRPTPNAHGPPPLFLCDAMLWRLARWLRVLGLDAATLPVETPDAALVRHAEAEGRVMLTRDRHLLRELRPARGYFVTSQVAREQLREVVRAFALEEPVELFTRCLVCNAGLEEVPPGDVAALLPESARGLPGAVRRCVECRRVYWRGSHARRMEGVVRGLFAAGE